MSWAEKYIGIPWRTGGREVERGLDCWGLLRYVYKQEFDIDLHLHGTVLGYLTDGGNITSIELAGEHWSLQNAPVDGDAVALGRLGTFNHVGVYVGLEEPCMLHIARKELSSIIPIKRLKEMSFDMVGYYCHAARHCNH